MVKALQRGDIVLVNCDLFIGREQKGIRPAVVMSSELYNSSSDIVILCPITSTFRKDSFVVPIISRSGKTTGYVLVDQVKAFDKNQRKVKKLDSITDECLEIIKAKLAALLIQ